MKTNLELRAGQLGDHLAAMTRLADAGDEPGALTEMHRALVALMDVRRMGGLAALPHGHAAQLRKQYTADIKRRVRDAKSPV